MNVFEIMAVVGFLIGVGILSCLGALVLFVGGRKY